MTNLPKGLNKKIKSIRKTLQMSLHDCAKILGTTTERYLAFEQGEESLSLPELEILAYYFGIPIMECLHGQLQINARFSLLQNANRSAYIKLREKWIRSRLALETENRGIVLEELAETLDITRSDLTGYKTGEMPIPLDHLQKICAYFNLPLEDFFPDLNEFEGQRSLKPAAGRWNPEFPNGQPSKDDNERIYNQLLEALKEIPEDNQAEIAKVILDKLKSI